MRLLPDNVLATQGRNRVLREQSLRDKKILDIPANLNWQDTGINLIEGMPVHIEAKGEWQVINEVGPEGVIIPENLKLRGINFQLGELIGVIRTSTKDRDSKPFKIGAWGGSGRLWAPLGVSWPTLSQSGPPVWVLFEGRLQRNGVAVKEVQQRRHRLLPPRRHRLRPQLRQPLPHAMRQQTMPAWRQDGRHQLR